MVVSQLPLVSLKLGPALPGWELCVLGSPECCPQASSTTSLGVVSSTAPLSSICGSTSPPCCQAAALQDRVSLQWEQGQVGTRLRAAQLTDPERCLLGCELPTVAGLRCVGTEQPWSQSTSDSTGAGALPQFQGSPFKCFENGEAFCLVGNKHGAPWLFSALGAELWQSLRTGNGCARQGFAGIVSGVAKSLPQVVGSSAHPSPRLQSKALHFTLPCPAGHTPCW